MTHDECLAAIFRRLSDAAAPAPWPVAVEEHLADCSDCWATVAQLHGIAAGAPPPRHARLTALYACDTIRDQLPDLLHLSPRARARRAPAVERHLSWCEPCRERLAVLSVIDAEPVTEERGPAADPLASLRTLGARAVIAIRGGVAEFIALHGLAPIPVAAIAMRGADPHAPLSARARLIGPAGAPCEMTARGRHDGRVDLEITLHAAVPVGSVLWLRTADEDDVIAAESARADVPMRIEGVPPGRYVLVLPGALARVAIDVESHDA